MSRIAIITYSDLPGLANGGKAGNGILSGKQDGGTTVNINETYVNVDMTTSCMSIMAQIYTGSTLNAIVALEGDWSGGNQKGFINEVNGGTINFSGAFDVYMLAFYSGGIIGTFPSGILTV